MKRDRISEIAELIDKRGKMCYTVRITTQRGTLLCGTVRRRR